ncbi:MAG: GNAT family N-acetyltransferase [Pirellulales bacterium]
MSTIGIEVGAAPRRQQADALRLVFGHLEEPARSNTVASALAAAGQEAAPLAGLLLARQHDRVVGATWLQVLAGGAAVLWPPGTVPETPPEAARLLVEAAIVFARQQRATLVQAVLPRDVDSAPPSLLDAGFTHLADLRYMISTQESFPAERPETPLLFEPYADQNHPRLEAVLQATYRDTLDCPRISGLRSAQHVLAGYKATGSWDPGRWQLVRFEGDDVGCLLLTDHPADEYWELVYMGLMPSARGHGWGSDVVRHAQWMCCQAGRQRLVLAVDAANDPARGMYDRAGFWTWDERRIYLLSLPSESI